MTTIDKVIQKTKNQPLQTILTAMSPRIIERVEKINQSESSKGRPMSEFAIEVTTLEMIYDLSKSILKYTDDSDSVVKFETFTGMKGFEIISTIERNGKQYSFSTDAILAGGYNIQTLHVRYIVRTNLPTTNNFSFANSIKEEIKFKNKIARKQEEIDRLESRLEEKESKVAKMKKMTREDAIAKLKKNDDWYVTKPLTPEMTWFKDQQEFDTWIDNTNEESIERILVRDVKHAENEVIMFKGWIKTAQKQLEKIKNQ